MARRPYTSHKAVVTNHAALRSLGIIIGSADDDKLVMREDDWRRALHAGAVRLLESIRSPDTPVEPPSEA